MLLDIVLRLIYNLVSAVISLLPAITVPVLPSPSAFSSVFNIFAFLFDVQLVAFVFGAIASFLIFYFIWQIAKFIWDTLPFGA